MSRTIALIGSTGQLAFDLARVWAGRFPADRVAGLTHRDIEVGDLESVRSALAPLCPQIVINTAAYHKVDAVEDDPARAFAVNAVGARHVALACREIEAVLVHLSTDYVYSGRKGTPYVEADPADPINVYGVSKAAGEMLVRYLWPRHFIVRGSGLYGVAGPSGKGSNFVELMLRLAREGRPIKVVDDQRLTPTPTVPLAEQIADLVQTGRFGTYHATCQGDCTWFEFAAEIFRQAGFAPSLSPQTTEQSGAKATRPTSSVLDNFNLRRAGLDHMPSWQDGLATYLAGRSC